MDLTSLNSVGMVLIIVSWAAQIMWMMKGRKEITAIFASLQLAGILLIIAGVTGSAPAVATLNAVSAIGAAIVLGIILTGGKKPVTAVNAAKPKKAKK